VPIPTDTIDKLAATWRATSELGATLTEAQWKTPTDLPGWTVQDNLSHLVAFERVLEGLPSTEHRAADLSVVRNPIGEANEHEVDARRHLTGAAVLAEWDDIVARRLRTLRSADEAYFEQPAMTPTGPGTVADFLHIRVLDCWSHDQDMRRALGIGGNDDTPAAAHTIDRLVRTLGMVVAKRAGTPDGQAVAIDITGPVERHLVFEVRDGRAQAVDRPSAAPAATVRLDSATFATLALGRRTADELIDRIGFEGDTALARRIVDQLNMMI
jgi:uncharacterized protein (TIGR03083 family)